MSYSESNNSASIAAALSSGQGVKPAIVQASEFRTKNYEFRKPQNTLAATLFPSRYTYHQLYGADNLEILENLISIESSPNKSETQKNDETNQIYDIVKSIPRIKDRARMIWTFIVFLVIIVIVYFSMADPWPTALTLGIIGGIALLFQFGWSTITLRGRQERAVDSISRPLQARKGAGQTTLAALQDLRLERRQQLQARTAQQGTGIAFLGGALFSSIFR